MNTPNLSPNFSLSLAQLSIFGPPKHPLREEMDLFFGPAAEDLRARLVEATTRREALEVCRGTLPGSPVREESIAAYQRFRPAAGEAPDIVLDAEPASDRLFDDAEAELAEALNLNPCPRACYDAIRLAPRESPLQARARQIIAERAIAEAR